MFVSDLMTSQTFSVEQGADIVQVARLMLEHDIGAVPVLAGGQPVGIITDRDIVIRSLGKGEDPVGHSVEDYMTPSIVTVTPETALEDCLNLMEEHQIRRMLVVDADGQLCGIVAQADIALQARDREKAELLEKVSA